MEQRTLNINSRIVYCYSDGSIEFFRNYGKGSVMQRTFGHNENTGYLRVKLDKKCYSVHRLIAAAFCPNPDNLPEIDHINRNRKDNRPENLRWVSSSTNCRNKAACDASKAKYGVQWCEDKKSYNRIHDRIYDQSHASLHAIQPSGKETKYYFSSVEDPIYKALKPLSRTERYYKYHELKGK